MDLLTYSQSWLSSLPGMGLKARSVDAYERCLRLYIVPALGEMELPTVNRAAIRARLMPRCQQLDGGTKSLILAVLRTMLSAACDEELIVANPVNGMSRMLRLGRKRGARPIKAMTGPQLLKFLAAGDSLKNTTIGACFRVVASTGLRIGEAMALRWPQVDFTRQSLTIVSTLIDGDNVGTPKTGRIREVHLEPPALQVLRRLHERRRSDWVFPSSQFSGRVPLQPCTVAVAMRTALAAAELPRHFTPHSLRHTYASLLLARGVPPQYVRQQLGHASIQMTVDVYGSALPVERPRTGLLEGLTD